LWLLEDIIQVLEQDKVSKADIYDWLFFYS
jgi:hypothetical protein